MTFRKFSLEQIKPHHVKSYIRQRTKKSSAIFEKKVLSALWSWAAGEGFTHAPNPCRGITFTKAERQAMAPKTPKVYVTDAMFDEVWARGDDVVQDAMDLALHTGQRPGDILKARRQDIVDGVLWFTQEKTGATVGVQVQDELERVLDRILGRKRPSIYLLSDLRGQRVSYDSLNARFRKARGDATWQFRAIRRKAGSDSTDLKRAQELLGHTNEATTAASYRDRGMIVPPLKRKTARI
jgi:integrase